MQLKFAWFPKLRNVHLIEPFDCCEMNLRVYFTDFQTGKDSAVAHDVPTCLSIFLASDPLSYPIQPR